MGGHSTRVVFTYYAGVIKELSGEPRLPAAEQIARARDAGSRWSGRSWDVMMADLIENPTIGSGACGRARNVEDTLPGAVPAHRRAAYRMYSPEPDPRRFAA